MDDQATFTELLADVKLNLNITWADEGTDRKVTGIIRNCIIYFKALLGGSADVSQPGLLRELFMDRCRYSYNEALDAFEDNYRSLLVALVNDWRLDHEATTDQE